VVGSDPRVDSTASGSRPRPGEGRARRGHPAWLLPRRPPRRWGDGTRRVTTASERQAPW